MSEEEQNLNTNTNKKSVADNQQDASKENQQYASKENQQKDVTAGKETKTLTSEKPKETITTSQNTESLNSNEALNMLEQRIRKTEMIFAEKELSDKILGLPNEDRDTIKDLMKGLNLTDKNTLYNNYFKKFNERQANAPANPQFAIPTGEERTKTITSLVMQMGSSDLSTAKSSSEKLYKMCELIAKTGGI